MVSFSQTFPDVEILSILGDDIEHIRSSGGVSDQFKGVFEFKYLDEELGDRMDIVYPVVTLNDEDGKKVKPKSKLKVHGATYNVFKIRPASVGKIQIILER